MNSKKRCRQCKKYSYTDDMVCINAAYFCNIEEAVKYAYKNKEKGKVKKHREQKKAFVLNDKQKRTKFAQQSFNAFIRERDKNEPCISCSVERKETAVHKGSNFHAGHYKTTAARPDLRFNEDNVHKQCAYCNNHLSGNIGEYKTNLLIKIGPERFLALTLNRVKSYSCEELKEIELLYKRKLKELVQGVVP